MLTITNQSIGRTVASLCLAYALGFSGQALAAEAIFEVTLETLQRQMQEQPIEGLNVSEEASTERLTLIRATLGEAQENGDTNVTIIMRELERDPPRTKVRVLTDTPIQPQQEVWLTQVTINDE